MIFDPGGMIDDQRGEYRQSPCSGRANLAMRLDPLIVVAQPCLMPISGSARASFVASVTG
jgi:hypothetical protein